MAPMTSLNLTYRKLLLMVTGSLLFFTGLNAQQPHPLDALLAYAPQRPAFQPMTANTISFADYRVAEVAAGLDPIADRDAYDALTDEERTAWQAAMLRVHAGPSSFLNIIDQRIAEMPDLLGFGFFDVDAGMTYGSNPFTGTMLYSDDGDFSRLETGRALRERDYEIRFTAAGGAWGKGGDGMTDVNDMAMGDPFGGDVGLASRVQVFTPNVLINSFIWDIVFVAAETTTGDAPNYGEDAAYQTMVEALTTGDELLVQTMILNAEAGTAQGTSEEIDPLPPYTLAAIADLQDGENQVDRLVLLYEDEDDAETAADALAEQITTFDQGWFDLLGVEVGETTVTEADAGYLVTLDLTAYAPTPQEIIEDGAYQPGTVFGFWVTALGQGHFFPFAVLPPSD